MNIKKIVAVALAVALVGVGSVRAQGTLSVNSQLSSQSWMVQWNIDSSIIFAANGQSTYVTASPLEYGTQTAVWDIRVTFNNGSASVSATTPYLSPVFNWQISNPLGSTTSVSNLFLANLSQATNGESAEISGITLNGGPVSGQLVAGNGQSFAGMMVSDNSSPITSLEYTLTVSTPSSWELENQAGEPALLTELAIPGTVPEPSTWALGVVGATSLFLWRRRRK